MSNTIPRPESFFGFRLGSDRNIARWDKIVDYFNLMDDRSENIQVINMGATTEGNPFLLAIISSASNLARLDELKRINAQIADPRGLSQARISRLIKNRSRGGVPEHESTRERDCRDANVGRVSLRLGLRYGQGNDRNLRKHDFSDDSLF